MPRPWQYHPAPPAHTPYLVHHLWILGRKKCVKIAKHASNKRSDDKSELIKQWLRSCSKKSRSALRMNAGDKRSVDT